MLEYVSITVNPDELGNQLNAFGQDGWEIVIIRPEERQQRNSFWGGQTSPLEVVTQYRVVLKRQQRQRPPIVPPGNV